MTWKLDLGGRTIGSAAELSVAVRDDAEAGGGTVVAGQRPSRWVTEALQRGEIPADEVLDVAEALLRADQPVLVVEGARLAAILRLPVLSEVIREVLAEQDLGLLLARDPLSPRHSIEDTLLRAWAAAADLRDGETRRDLLDHLRNAGLPDVEIPVLALFGTPEEIATWMPAVLEEGLPDGVEQAVGIGLLRADPGSEALLTSLGRLPQERRVALWDRASEAVPHLAGREDLRRALVA